MIVLFLVVTVTAKAQLIQGVVTDSTTHQPIPYTSVKYAGKGVGCVSSSIGAYHINQHKGWYELTFSAIGYKTRKVRFSEGESVTLNLALIPVDQELKEVVIKPKKEKYKRKDNPAVELMRKVIAHKKSEDLHDNAYFQYNKYDKITTSLNDVKLEDLDNGIFKKMPFLKNQVEICPETNKLIIPLTYQETASREIYRKDPKNEKTIIRGINSQGLNKMFTLSSVWDVAMNDVFHEINIYDNQIRVLQDRFVSPISSIDAISFYKYYIMDTTMVDNIKCIHLTFVPQNSQDFGFIGHLYITYDSTYQVKKISMDLPIKSDVNFVNSLHVEQEYDRLSNGSRGLMKNDMIVELAPTRKTKNFQFQVRKITIYNNYAFGEIPNKSFDFIGSSRQEDNALTRDDKFWSEVRGIPLLKTEETINQSVKGLMAIRGFKAILLVSKAFIENSVETGEINKSKFDFAPVNTVYSYNNVEGSRLRLSLMTTANLFKQTFFSGYVARGMKDNKWKGEGSVEFSFNKKAYTPIEFPRHSLQFTAMYDMVAPEDKFLRTDKDNMLLSFKTKEESNYTYQRNFGVTYLHELPTSLSYKFEFHQIRNTPAGGWVYQKNDSAGTVVKDFPTTEISANIRYSPGETYINSKTKRVPVSFDSPVFSVTQTMGLNNFLGGKYDFNMTEVEIWKRFWLSSYGWLDLDMRGAKQWNKVPYPLLIIPPTNLSYFIQVGSGAFSLLNSMEFLNDEYASAFASWNINGKIFNRIPIIKKFKWREVLGFNIMYGHLSDKNNPAMSSGLFKFPDNSYTLEKNKPYMEMTIGIHNIFKLLAIEYVRRLNYLNHPGISNYGIRFAMIATF